MPVQYDKPAENPFSVLADSDLPVGVQLAWRLRTLILTGRLGPGDTLPSVRRLADWANVNPNTVRGVYDVLQDEGFTAAKSGKGTFVADTNVSTPQLEAIALEAIERCQQSGVNPRDLGIAVMACADMLESEVPAPPVEGRPRSEEASGETLEVRRELRRQIAQLETELAPYARDLPPGEMPTAPLRAAGHVAGVEELEQIRDILIAKLFKARDSAVERAKRESRARAGRADNLGSGPLARAMSWWRQTT